MGLNNWPIVKLAVLTVVAYQMLGTLPACALPLSPGDRLRITIPEGELFNGIYEVNLDGNIQVPYLDPISVKGLELSDLERELTRLLVGKGYFNPTFIKVNVAIIEWAAVQVSVAGATFQPGLVLINARSAPDRALQQQRTTGDYPVERFLTAALRNAGGVTPDADVKSIRLIRDKQEKIIDLSGVFSGEPVEDIPLIAGDRIVVPKLAAVNNEQVRPSQITPPGIRVILSNLTVPASSNASASITREATTFAYGSRLSQAVISGNCAGGTLATNASRFAVLVRTERVTGTTKTWERSIEDLLKKPNEDSINPFLMPDDGVVCYDSSLTDARDVARTIGDFLNPINLLRGIFGGSNR
ncbi:polysaccharide biosynthesis/export family protein [Pseudanabaena sp. PCC 6802]|uniref:polysaccharide biosynthesis/export family protein n=1 Tax=Pseudanabaena sp. PCC 6802 TaxID=118173 RepID=UPI0003457982|nr:polysaccharide biosynthesis/export family protein [Pseudanabaena sp. PCC 6802]